MGWVSNTLVLLSVYGFLRCWAEWRTRNLPFAKGGSFANTFNDPDWFCCVYSSPPCSNDTACSPRIDDPQRELRVPGASIVRWVFHGVALAIAFVAWASKRGDYWVVSGGVTVFCQLLYASTTLLASPRVF